ncbi:hypothetical protein KBA27_04645, partial [bacterium]|nr:hypothetical protein [bacterium]
MSFTSNVQNPQNSTQVVKPQTPAGHLVSSSFLDAPANFVSDTVYDLKSVKDGIKGKSNDHEQGKVNDFAMKMGGLGIASYLFTQKALPSGKAMEFVGLASFFTSMALWPKIAIELPAYIKHGFNVQKRYVDSNGRKKPVFQDPQYIPFDLYSDKEISKIGDKLGVPKNIENRRNVVQDKMKQIATQNNTLWMLTSGFATPIMSALICNQAEKYVNKFQSKGAEKNANKLFSNMETKLSKFATAPNSKIENVSIKDNAKYDEVVNSLKGKELTAGAYEKLASAFIPTDELPTSFARQLQSVFESDKYRTVKTDTPIFNEESVSGLHKGLVDRINEVKSNPKSMTPETIKYMEASMLTEDELKNLCRDNLGKPVTEDLNEKVIAGILDKFSGIYAKDKPALDSKLKNDVKADYNAVNDMVKNTFMKDFVDKFVTEPAKSGKTIILDGENIKKISRQLLDSSKKLTVTDSQCDAVQSCIYMPNEIESILKENIGKPVTEDTARALNQSMLNNVGITFDDYYKKGLNFGNDFRLDLKSKVEDIVYKFIPVKRNVSPVSTVKNILDEAKIKKLDEIKQTVANYNDMVSSVDSYRLAKTGDKENSVLANDCNEVRAKLADILGFSKEEMETARNNHFKSAEVIRNRFEKISSSDELYKSTVKKLADVVNSFVEKYPETTGGKDLTEKEKFEKYVDGAYNKHAEAFKAIGLNDTAKSIAGEGEFEETSAKYLQKLNYSQRISGVKGTFYNIIQDLDIYRRISNIEKLSSANVTAEQKSAILKSMGPVADKTATLSEKQEMIELAKRAISFHSADLETRFFTKRMKLTDSNNLKYEDVVVKGGKVLDNGKAYEVPKNAVEINYDTKFYKNSMNFIYNTALDKDT